MSHINRLITIFSLLTVIVPLSATAMLLRETHVLGAAVVWWMF